MSMFIAEMQIPAGLVSIGTGRFFGIRYFLNVQISCAFNRRVRIQLPITLIHPNSIDIPPNSLAQVTASIEHKHRQLTSTSGTGSPYRYRAGQAFTTARRQSYLQLRREAFDSSDLDSIARAVDASPRKFFPAPLSKATHSKKLKVKRRQSTAALGSSNSSNHHRRRSTLSKHTSIDHGLKYKFSKPSFDEMCRGTPGSRSLKVSLENARKRSTSRQRVSFDKTPSKTLKSHFGSSHQRVSLDRSPSKKMKSSFENSNQRVPFDKSPSKTLQSDYETEEPSGQVQSELESNVRKHLRIVSEGSSMGLAPGPRLQRSTSGMGFEDSDKENQEPKWA